MAGMLGALICVTTGPALAPIDGVRHITNRSTGELGVILAHAFSAAGARVRLFRGVGATRPSDFPAEPFTTNDSLWTALASLPEKPAAVFHAAAMCDFDVVPPRGGKKLESRSGGLTLELKPARKLLVGFRDVFPKARIVGWKYELDGGREDALACAQRQLGEARSDACVVNGAAFGSGFGLVEPEGLRAEFPDKAALAAGLVTWLGARL